MYHYKAYKVKGRGMPLKNVPGLPPMFLFQKQLFFFQVMVNLIKMHGPLSPLSLAGYQRECGHSNFFLSLGFYLDHSFTSKTNSLSGDSDAVHSVHWQYSQMLKIQNAGNSQAHTSEGRARTFPVVLTLINWICLALVSFTSCQVQLL